MTRPLSPTAIAPPPTSVQGAGAGWYRQEEAIMGTSIEVELQARDRAEAEVAIAAVMAEMHRIDATMSPHKCTSELSILNAHAADNPITVSDGLFTLLAKAL